MRMSGLHPLTTYITQRVRLLVTRLLSGLDSFFVLSFVDQPLALAQFKTKL